MMDKIFFGCVVILFLFSFHYRQYALDARDAFLLRAAMAFTVAADFCMLVLYENLAGLCFFCAVQTLYHYRYTGGGRVVRQLALCALTLAALSFLTSASWMDRAAACYAVCLLASVSGAIAAFGKKKYPRPNNRIVLAGMVCFLLCDINVGIYHLLPVGSAGVFQALIWFFYLPSQALLSVSAKNYTTKSTC